MRTCRGTVRIECPSGAVHDTRLWIDEEEIKGITRIELDMDIHEVSLLKITTVTGPIEVKLVGEVTDEREPPVDS